MANGNTVASIDVSLGVVYETDISTSIVADAYSNETTYESGDYAIFNRILYKCIVAIATPEDFNSEKWERVKLATEIEEIANTKELPEVTSLDNGKILKVVNGTWNKASPDAKIVFGQVTSFPNIEQFNFNKDALAIIKQDLTVPIVLSAPIDGKMYYFYRSKGSMFVWVGKDSTDTKIMYFTVNEQSTSDYQTINVTTETVGGSANQPLFVTVTKSGNTYTADYTYQQIKTAIDSGIVVYVKDTAQELIGENIVLTFSHIDPNSAPTDAYVFSAIKHDSYRANIVSLMFIDGSIRREETLINS